MVSKLDVILEASKDLRIAGYLHPAYLKIMNDVEKQIKAAIPKQRIDSVKKDHKVRDLGQSTYSLTLEGTTSSDLLAKASLVLSFDGNSYQIFLWGKRPDWGSNDRELIDMEEGKGTLPVDRIVNQVKVIFGV